MNAFALVDRGDNVFVDTVSSTERVAMVNALVAVFNQPVLDFHTDRWVKLMFKQRAGDNFRLAAVDIITL